jgi:hypothetical protein
MLKRAAIALVVLLVCGTTLAVATHRHRPNVAVRAHIQAPNLYACYFSEYGNMGMTYPVGRGLPGCPELSPYWNHGRPVPQPFRNPLP